MRTPGAPHRRPLRIGGTLTWKADPRSDRQRRVADFLVPAIAVGIAIFVVLARGLAHHFGEHGSAILGVVVAATPIVTVYRYGIDGQAGRRAIVEGVGAALLIAGIYWWVFVRPLPERWW